MTSLKASGALTGAVVITDLAEAAEVDISAAIGNDLTINQINSAGGSDTLTVILAGVIIQQAVLLSPLILRPLRSKRVLLALKQ